MHQVVLQNRLEQLRLRQREDALKVQSDVAALVSSTHNRLAAGVEDGEDELEDIEEEVGGDDEEVWDEEEMEIERVDPAKFSYEDRLVPVLDSDEVLKKLVCFFLSSFLSLLSFCLFVFTDLFLFLSHSVSLRNEDKSPPPNSSLGPLDQPSTLVRMRPPLLPIYTQKHSTEPKPTSSWTRTRRSLISRKDLAR